MLQIEAKILFDPDCISKKHYRQNWKRTAMAITNCDIADYYANFVQKRFGIKLNKPIRGSHITFINDRINDVELYEEGKKFFNGKKIMFQYDPKNIRITQDFVWLNVESDDALNIREALGLPREYFYKLHITLGTINPRYIENIPYILENIKMFNI